MWSSSESEDWDDHPGLAWTEKDGVEVSDLGTTEGQAVSESGN